MTEGQKKCRAREGHVERKGEGKGEGGQWEMERESLRKNWLSPCILPSPSPLLSSVSHPFFALWFIFVLFHGFCQAYFQACNLQLHV